MFLRSLGSKVQSAEARGLKPDMNEYKPLQRGESVIGVVTDTGLLALMQILDEKQAAFFLRWPEPPTNVREMKAAIVAGEEVETLRKLVQYEIRTAFAMGPEDPVVLRQGYDGPVVVNPAPADVPQDGLTVAAIAEVKAVKRTIALDSIQENFRKALARATEAGCGNPACTVCGTEARLRKISRAFTTALEATEALVGPS